MTEHRDSAENAGVDECPHGGHLLAECTSRCTAERDGFCLPCWDEAGEWVDREGGTQALHYDRLHKHHTPPGSSTPEEG